tara:strand:+ start:880 stop:1062 length:183 start_codon:yes stop_codon:yes gene_type:complete
MTGIEPARVKTQWCLKPPPRPIGSTPFFTFYKINFNFIFQDVKNKKKYKKNEEGWIRTIN